MSNIILLRAEKLIEGKTYLIFRYNQPYMATYYENFSEVRDGKDIHIFHPMWEIGQAPIQNFSHTNEIQVFKVPYGKKVEAQMDHFLGF